MHATAEAHAPAEELVVQVGEVRDLFAAPEVDPLAQHEGEVMGEPALLRVVRRLMAARMHLPTLKHRGSVRVGFPCRTLRARLPSSPDNR